MLQLPLTNCLLHETLHPFNSLLWPPSTPCSSVSAPHSLLWLEEWSRGPRIVHSSCTPRLPGCEQSCRPYFSLRLLNETPSAPCEANRGIVGDEGKRRGCWEINAGDLITGAIPVAVILQQIVRKFLHNVTYSILLSFIIQTRIYENDVLCIMYYIIFLYTVMVMGYGEGCIKDNGYFHSIENTLW